ncbi:MAG: twin-arginine translocase TatA/TatE family subunit [Chloroflexi bacterium]|nr:twin-arginine translocase TatA/TatE family subunit [Chloroflexota bacterium]
MPFRLGPLEIGLILVIILIVFGVGKLPQVGSAIGKSLREFRKAQRGEDEESSERPIDSAQGKPAEKSAEKPADSAQSKPKEIGK